MPFFESADASIYYEFENKPGLPILLFSNSLGTNLSMWNPQLERLRADFSILRYDTRGHGRSSVTPGPYSIEQHGQDAIALLDHLALARVNFCGLSMGGLIGLWLGLHASDRIESLVLSNTAAHIGTLEAWDQRIKTVNKEGIEPLVTDILNRWFTEGFRHSHPSDVLETSRMLLSTNPRSYVANCAAIRDADFRPDLERIVPPTLVLFGLQDPMTTPTDAEFLVRNLPCATSAGLQSAHLANIECADEWSVMVSGFFRGIASCRRGVYTGGMKVRREVLGDAHVDRSISNEMPFNAPFNDFITRYAWGEIWQRPGLTRHSRSLITLALMLALNREDEFKMHVRAAFNNGVTVPEIQEVLLHCALYCGLPATNSAFHWAQTVINELDRTVPSDKGVS